MWAKISIEIEIDESEFDEKIDEIEDRFTEWDESTAAFSVEIVEV